jgi:hypothetical protein
MLRYRASFSEMGAAKLSAIGFSHIGSLTACPQPVEADIRPLGGAIRVLTKREIHDQDTSATLAVHCGNGLTADFSPYQSTRLRR